MIILLTLINMTYWFHYYHINFTTT